LLAFSVEVLRVGVVTLVSCDFRQVVQRSCNGPLVPNFLKASEAFLKERCCAIKVFLTDSDFTEIV
jgi:hypothetical protein